MLCPEELAVAINAIAIAIAQGQGVPQLNALSAIYTQIGDTLATIAVQKSNIEACIASRQAAASKMDDTIEVP